MTECNGCGGCCDPVASFVAPVMLADRSADAAIGKPAAEWMRDHLTPVRPRRDGIKRAPYLRGGGTSTTTHRGQPTVLLVHFYDCEFFDRESRECRAYDLRPEMCRVYPWVGDEVNTAVSLPGPCSFRADQGLPVEEVPVEWRRS